MPGLASDSFPLPLDLFSSVTIYGITDSADGQPVPFTMKRDISFPHQMFHFAKPTEKVWEHSMQPHPVPTNGLHLELELGDLIGHGTAGHVYAVRVVRVSSSGNEDTGSLHTHIDVQLPELCIKLAEPHRTRGSAREAWFYEQLRLEGLEGVTSPGFYGFFTSTCDHTRVVPWRTDEWSFKTEEDLDLFESEDPLMHMETVGSEPYEDDDRWFDDELGSHQNSKWLDFRSSRSDPLVSILLLEKLGETLHSLYKIEDCSFIKDADQVLEDIVWKGFYHEDVRYNQFAIAPNPIRCPRHKRTHKVFVLDFELVYRVPPIHNDRDLARWKQYNLMRLNPGLRRK